MSEGIKNLNNAEFEGFLKNNKAPTLVDFWAPWCGPCRQVAPVLEGLAEELGSKATIAKVNVDEEPGLAQKFGVQSIPTMIVFKEGEEVNRLVGFQGPDTIKNSLLANG